MLRARARAAARGINVAMSQLSWTVPRVVCVSVVVVCFAGRSLPGWGSLWRVGGLSKLLFAGVGVRVIE